MTRSESERNRRMTLNLGCGNKPLADAINLDVTTATRPDVVHNLNSLPWPFPNNRFAEVLANDVIEHLDDIPAVFEELHRICQPGAIVRLTVPHYSCPNAYTDPTHRHAFGRFSFAYFTAEHELAFYSTARFRERACNLMFHPRPVNKIVSRLANRYPQKYEERWAWIFPAWFIYAELEVVKDNPARKTTATRNDD